MEPMRFSSPPPPQRPPPATQSSHRGQCASKKISSDRFHRPSTSNLCLRVARRKALVPTGVLHLHLPGCRLLLCRPPLLRAALLDLRQLGPAKVRSRRSRRCPCPAICHRCVPTTGTHFSSSSPLAILSCGLIRPEPPEEPQGRSLGIQNSSCVFLCSSKRSRTGSGMVSGRFQERMTSSSHLSTLDHTVG